MEKLDLIQAVNLDTGVVSLVTLEYAMRDLGGGTSKYDDYIKLEIEKGKRLKTDYFIYQKEVI